jgi:ATP synthase protein I
MIEKMVSIMVMTLSDDNKGVFKSFLSYSSLGLEMGLSVAIGIAMGYFLDKYFKTYPYLTVIFMFFGIGAAMKAVFRVWKKAQREEEDERNNLK